MVLYAPQEHGRRAPVLRQHFVGHYVQPSPDHARVGVGRAQQREPFGPGVPAIEIVAPCEVAERDAFAALCAVAAQHQRHGVFLLGDVREAVEAPVHGHQERFAAQLLNAAGARTATQEHGPPFAVGCLHYVGMASAGNRVGAPRFQFALREHRVAAPAGVRAKHRVGPVGHFRVEYAGAAFGADDVVLAVDFIYVRAFVACQALLGAHARFAELDRCTRGLARSAVKPCYAQAAVVAPLGLPFGRLLVYDIGLAVVVEEERRVDAVDGWQPYGVAPVVVHWVFGCDVEVAAPHIGGKHVVSAGLRVETNVGCIDAPLAHVLSGKRRQL